MTTRVADGGWLYLKQGSDDMTIKCVSFEYDWEWNPDITDYTGGGHYGYDLVENAMIIKVKDIIFKPTGATTGKSKLETFLAYLRSWQSSGAITLKLQVTTGSAYLKLDGTNTTWPVLAMGLKKVVKVANENQDIWKVGQIIFRSAGAPSA